MRSYYLLTMLAIALGGVSACCGSHSAAAPAQAPAAQVLTPGYYCPMHASVRSDKPGRCPICGMELRSEAEDEPPYDPLRPPDPGATRLPSEDRSPPPASRQSAPSQGFGSGHMH